MAKLDSSGIRIPDSCTSMVRPLLMASWSSSNVANTKREFTRGERHLSGLNLEDEYSIPPHPILVVFEAVQVSVERQVGGQ